ncbi:diacylglycerol-acyltransferase [Obelidium mucronatum]|nr:diacylglycerol-acyltransferase [Obelidium mucronatum]
MKPSHELALVFHFFIFSCAFHNDRREPTRAIAVIYVIYINLDKTYAKGNPGSKWFRSHPFWKSKSAYYPAKLHKTADLPPDRPYILGYHPHGVICVGSAVSFGTEALGVSTLFPGVEIKPSCLNLNFLVPGFREMLLAAGYIGCGKKDLQYCLSRNKSVVLVVGGAQESMDAIPGTNTLTIKKRFGFVKLALQNGASLVPVFGFGENDIWSQVNNSEGTLVRRFQETVKGILFQYRRPINVVIENPSNEQVLKYHTLYVDALEKLYNDHKDKYLPDRTSDLVIG